jgi:trimeric autotransporter adhesin
MDASSTRRFGLVAATAALLAVSAAPASAQPITGLTHSNQLFTFDSADPGDVSALTPITGLEPGDQLSAIDRNPNDGVLYGIGVGSRVYRITDAGVATAVGPQISPSIAADDGIDFNSAGLLRITSSDDRNFLWNPATGNATPETNLAYVAGDANVGANPTVDALAYTNNFPQATNQTLYGYDRALGILVRVGSVGGARGSCTPSAPSARRPASLDWTPPRTGQCSRSASTAPSRIPLSSRSTRPRVRTRRWEPSGPPRSTTSPPIR